MIAGPLSAAQQRVWIVSRLAGGVGVYVIPFGVRLSGRLDTGRLRAAIDATIRRHPMLRLRVREGADGPEGVIADASPTELPVLDISATPARDREARALALADAEVRRPFDLAADAPLFRVSLVRLSAADHLLIWPIHHIACDGASLRLLLRDLLAAYARLSENPSGEPFCESPDESADESTGVPTSEPASEVANASTNGAAMLFDLARRERDVDAERTARQHTAFWRERLQDAPRLLAMPADRPRPAQPTFAGLTTHAVLRADTVRAAEALARAARVSPFALYSAAFHAWLSRYSGDRTTLLGFTAAARDDAASQERVGLFANLLVQRADVEDDSTARALAVRVHAEIARAVQHDRLRFDWLARELGAAGSSAHPVFQALIDYYGAPEAIAAAAGGLRAELLLFDTATARFDLELSLRHTARGGGDLAVALKCNADLFERATAERMVSHLVRFIGAFVAHPDAPVSTLSMLSDEERRAAIVRASGPHLDVPADLTLHDAVAAVCREFPDRCAIRAGGASYSFGDLDRRSRAIAHALGRRIAPGAIVGVTAPRSFDLVAALLGILRAGAVCLPLDPDYPPERLRFMIADASAALVLATRDTAAAVRSAGTASLLLLDELDAPAGAAESGVESDASDAPVPRDALAYILYTSGSTGRPKGVANTHRGLLNRLWWMQDAYRLRAADAVLHKTSIGFDVFLWEVFWPLLAGCRLILAPPGAQRHPHELRAAIASEQVTVVHFVPSMLRAFVDEGGFRGCESLRLIVSSGEVLWRSLCDAVLAGTTAALHNLYGPTEAAIDVTAFDCRDAPIGQDVPIGRPIANTQVHVLDRRLSPVPIGVVGELCIGGPQVARGYVDRPDETQARFVADPFRAPFGAGAGEPPARLYRTGDLGRVRADGTIEFIGRADAQIKLHGNRIEPAEIEVLLTSTARAARSIVCLDPHSPSPRLVAFVERGSASMTADELSAALAARLPVAMRPSAIVLVDALPSLSSGKIDRRHLPWTALRPAAPRAATPPANDIETRLAEAWRATLGTIGGRDSGADDGLDVDVEQSFFTAGGDSMRSIELVVQARRRGLDLRVEDLFLHRTIRALARHARLLDASAPEEGAASATLRERPLHSSPPDSPSSLPLSSLLAHLVDVSSHGADYRIYVTSVTVAAPFDAACLAVAAERVMRQHPFLRSTIDTGAFDDGVIGTGLVHAGSVHADAVDTGVAQMDTRAHTFGAGRQIIHRDVRPDIRLHDLRHLPADTRESQLAAWLEQERATAFDWSRAPLWRLTAHRLLDTAFQLTLSEPFLDGWSATLALTELLDRYEEALDGRAAPEAGSVSCSPSGPTADIGRSSAGSSSARSGTESRSGYHEFLQQERAAIASAPERRFWQAHLRTLPVTRLGDLAWRGADGRGHVRDEVDVPAAVSASLRALARELGVGLKAVLLAAHVRALAALTGEADVSTGVMSHARPETRGGQQAIGLFLNVLPLRASFAGRTWHALIRELHAAEAALLPHRAYPFTQMLRDTAQGMPSDALFNFTHFHPYARRRAHPAVRVERIRAFDQTYFPLTAQFRQDSGDGVVHLALEFGPSHGGAEARRTAAEAYRDFLSDLAASPEALCARPRAIAAASVAIDAGRGADHGAGSAADRGSGVQAAASRVSSSLQSPSAQSSEQTEHHACVHTAFEAQARRTPDAIAIVMGTHMLTYDALRRRVEDIGARLAAHLSARPGGARSDLRIGVCLPRSADVIASALAIMRAGGRYVPLDSSLPAARLKLLHGLGRCDAVLVTPHTQALFPRQQTIVIDIDIDNDIDASASAVTSTSTLTSAAAPIAGGTSASTEAPAYMMFTSGASGVPKPVVVPHRAVMNRLRWQWHEHPYAPGDVASFRSSIGFVDSIAEMFGGLLAGTPTNIVDESSGSVPHKLIAALAAGGVTHVTMTPTLLAEILRIEGDLLASLPRLRSWTLSGEPLPAALAQTLMLRRPGTIVLNLYGSTEVAADATWHRVNADDSGATVPVGRPIAGVEARVIDALGDIARPGVTGELVIGGTAVGTGYAGDPALTAQAFIPDPWGAPGGRLYRTGDLARRDRDGLLWYAGRRDRQIKIRGVRVEPADAEAALRQQPGILDAIVDLRETAAGTRRLVGYVRLRDDCADRFQPHALHTRLRRALYACLPAASVPDLYCVCGEWPRTGSGKIDRAALPLPDLAAGSSGGSGNGGGAADDGGRERDAPDTAIERRLADLWAQCLRLQTPEIGRTDDFFLLGGESLRATMLATMIRESWGIDFPVADIFDRPALDDQAALIQDKLLVSSRKGASS